MQSNRCHKISRWKTKGVIGRGHLIRRKAIGIDLGTTNSAVSVTRAGESFVIDGRDNEKVTPSIITYMEDGTAIVGARAKNHSATSRTNTFFSVKRLLGRRVCELDNRIFELLPYSILRQNATDEIAKLVCPAKGKHLLPQEISAELLKELKTSAEDHLQEAVREAVIAVPAYFGPPERAATVEAAELAGLNVLRIINEPVAAAVAYGFGKEDTEFVLVFDLGGGTLDVSVLHVGDDVFEVLQSAGNNFLGGDDFDASLLDWILEGIAADQGYEVVEKIAQDPRALYQLREAAEKAKISLSSLEEVEMDIFIELKEDQAIDTSIKLREFRFHRKITREHFESMNAHLIDEMENILREVVHNVESSEGEAVTSENMEIILVGGASSMPCIHKSIFDFLGKEPKRLINPQLAVSIGAGMVAAALKGEGIKREDIILLDENPTAEDINLLAEKCSKFFE